MNIQRAVSQGTYWQLSLGQVPALLELIDDQQIPVDILLTQGASKVFLCAAKIFYRRQSDELIHDLSGTAIPLDTNCFQEARAVCRAAGLARQISLQLLDGYGEARLTITGPTLNECQEGAVWEMVMDSLLAEANS